MTHEQRLGQTPPALTPEMATADPEGFRIAAVEHMVYSTELGAAAWNQAIDTGTVRMDNFTVNPASWASFSKASDGYLRLGVAPMSPQQRERYLYQGEAMTYGDEVGRRLLHEVAHGGFALAQGQPHTRALLQATYAYRKSGPAGLSSLGGHGHYETPGDKAVEDAVELIT